MTLTMEVQNINSSFKSNVKKIYHMADLHIRLGSERHAEYREVFNKLYTVLSYNFSYSFKFNL